MDRKNLTLALLLVILTAAVSTPRQSEAIPAFARQHKLSCTACHAPFPRLKDFGEEFAGNGFALPEQENARDFVNTGDDDLKLNKTFPLAARFDLYGIYEDGQDLTNDLRTPYGAKLLSGGTVAKNVGYYFYFFMSERGEVVGIEDAYIHFNDVGGIPFDIMIGQFQTSDPLMKRELRLTFEDYGVYRRRIGLSGINLTYDRGVMMTYDIAATGTGLVGLVVNGNGKDAADDNHFYEDDNYKNYGFRISQDISAAFRLGYFFYYGQEKGNNFDAGTEAMKNEMYYHGPDFTLGNGMFDLNFQYLFREDSNPTFLTADTDIKTEGMIVELVFAPHRDASSYYITLLYNQIDSGLDYDDFDTATISGTYLLARNLRFNLEYTRDIEYEFNRVGVGLVAAF